MHWLQSTGVFGIAEFGDLTVLGFAMPKIVLCLWGIKPWCASAHCAAGEVSLFFYFSLARKAGDRQCVKLRTTENRHPASRGTEEYPAMSFERPYLCLRARPDETL